MNSVDTPPPDGSPTVLGLDLSLTATGISNGTGATDTITTAGLTGHERLCQILERIRDAIHNTDASLVVIEGLSMNARDTNHAGAGLWYLVTHDLLWGEGVPYAVAPATNLKQYATGKGNASKDEVLAAVIRRWPEYLGADNNTADAWVLACMGRDHLGLPGVTMPATHRRALDKIVWPDQPEEQQ